MTRILVVEDSPSMLDNIAFNLEMQGYEVLQAPDARQALELLRTLPALPDVIVSDIAMPDMSGYEFLEVVQGNAKWRTIPFLFLTAFDSPNAIRLGKEMGADDYLVKPFEPQMLVIAIENKLRRAAQFRETAEQ